MANIHIYQIFYDQETRALVDPAFLPLDNSDNARPDWFEYWPIRKLLEQKTFSDDDYIGVFSPKFRDKTGFTGAQVHDFVSRSGAQIVGFSPEFDQIAIFQNAFAQGNRWQPGLLDVCRASFETLGLNADITAKWADQTRIIFSNYFVAKYVFWKEWFHLAEKIFQICEKEESALANSLRAFTRYRGTSNHYQMKVFVMERLVNAILENRNIDATTHFDFLHQRAMYNRRISNAGRTPGDYGRFLLLDALKGQYVKTSQAPFLNLFKHHLLNEVK